jgi:hypothetical protein
VHTVDGDITSGAGDFISDETLHIRSTLTDVHNGVAAFGKAFDREMVLFDGSGYEQTNLDND